LKKSLTRLDIPKIQVLLATYNGDRYLDIFLQSLVAQKNVDIELLVSDDGSEDTTLEIIKRFENQFSRVRVFAGPKSGAAANFFFLLKQVDAEFCAFADQDDIWLPNHLHDSVLRLEGCNGSALTFSSVLEFETDNPEKIKTWPKYSPDNDVTSLIGENYARGCTIVMNKNAADLINLYTPRHAVMHDWWALLVVALIGTISWSLETEVKYRIHSSNAIGTTPRFWVRLKRYMVNLSRRDSPSFRQVIELLQAYENHLPQQNREIFNKCRALSGNSPLSSKMRNLLRFGKVRSNTFSDLLWKCQVFFFKKGAEI